MGNRGKVFDIPVESSIPLIDPETAQRISKLIMQLESNPTTTEAASIQAEITRLAKFASQPPQIKLDIAARNNGRKD